MRDSKCAFYSPLKGTQKKRLNRYIVDEGN